MTAIQTIAAGGFIAEPRLVSSVDAGIADLPPADPDALTNRDREVLRLIAGGLSNREIARIRNLAEGTVKNRVSDILVKLGCRDRTQAVLYAIHWRLI